MIGDATVTIDPETRRVIVVTDEMTAMNVSQVISNLDHPKPQVLIKVVFLEVTHNDALDIGIEGSYSRSLQSVHRRHQYSRRFTPILPAIRFRLGWATIWFGGQGQVRSSAATKCPRAPASIRSWLGFYRHAAGHRLRRQEQILSRPSMLVRNNQPATITVGQSVPLVTGVT